jgi:glycosyltransferase involved in cell wall biosynthesis
MARADLYVLPTHTENFGLSIAEALASGVPVVVTTGAPWPGIETHSCGRWIEPGVENLIVAMGELMALDGASRREMGASGRAWIAREFSWEHIATTFEQTYEWLLSQKAKPDCITQNNSHEATMP